MRRQWRRRRHSHGSCGCRFTDRLTSSNDTWLSSPPASGPPESVGPCKTQVRWEPGERLGGAAWMSPGESAAPRNIQGCQVGPRAFWRPRRKGKVSGSTPAAASKARPHWHHVLSQCPSARHKKKKEFQLHFPRSNICSSDDGEARKTQMHFVLFCFCLAACVAPALFTPRLPSNIDFQKHIHCFYITFSHPQLVIFLGSKFTQTKCTAIWNNARH